MIMNNETFKYLPEYELLELIPSDQWLLFVTLTYGEAPPSNKYIFQDVMKWLENVSKTINYRPEQLVWFARIEDVEEDDFLVMPRHIHLCLHKLFLDTRIHNTNLRLWTAASLKYFLEDKWTNEHGGNCLVKQYDDKYTKPNGIGY